jgi:hypothetical protein
LDFLVENKPSGKPAPDEDTLKKHFSALVKKAQPSNVKCISSCNVRMTTLEFPNPKLSNDKVSKGVMLSNNKMSRVKLSNDKMLSKVVERQNVESQVVK